MTPPIVEKPQVWDTTLKLQDVIAAAMPNLGGTESRELEDLTEYRDIFAMGSNDYGWTDRLYDHIDTGEARLIRQPPRRLALFI